MASQYPLTTTIAHSDAFMALASTSMIGCPASFPMQADHLALRFVLASCLDLKSRLDWRLGTRSSSENAYWLFFDAPQVRC
jgi:hypothetical protein